MENYMKNAGVPVIEEAVEKKEMTIKDGVEEGDVGDRFGMGMESGDVVVVKGNAGDLLGEKMQGGRTIVVYGNSGEWTGSQMMDGQIIVKGNVGSGTGTGMVNGLLSIEGDVRGFEPSAFSSENKGKIVLHGDTIWENGNWTSIGREMNDKGRIAVSSK